MGTFLDREQAVNLICEQQERLYSVLDARLDDSAQETLFQQSFRCSLAPVEQGRIEMHLLFCAVYSFRMNCLIRSGSGSRSLMYPGWPARTFVSKRKSSSKGRSKRALKLTRSPSGRSSNAMHRQRKISRNGAAASAK